MKKSIEKGINRVVEKLITLDEIDGSEYSNLTIEEQQKIGYFSRDFGMNHWDWPQGVGLFGLSQLGNQYQEYITNWAEIEIGKGLPVPNINTVCPLLTIMDHPEYETLSLQWAELVMNKFERTTERGLQHNTTGLTKEKINRNHEQIWADTIFMTVLFLGKIGKKYQHQEWIDESIYQVLLHTKYLFDRKIGLFYHGWDFSKSSNFGANFWCRGNSWLAMGLPLFIDYMADELSEPDKKYLIQIYKNQVNALLSLLDEKENLWHTLLDDPTSYTETSGSAGILAGIYMGLNSGILPDEPYAEKTEDVLKALLRNIDEDGTIRGVSAGTAISHDREDYKNIIVKPMAYGQAMMLCALAESLKYMVR